MKGTMLRIAVLFLCMALVAGIYTFGVIPSVRKEEQEKSRKKISEITETFAQVPVYNGETALAKGTVMTEALAGLFTVMNVPVYCLNDQMITDIRAAYGFQISGNLCKGEPLTYANLEKAEFEENEEERLKEFSVSSTVCGKVTAGRYIDVTVKYGDGTYDVVLVKKRVYDVVNENNSDGRYTVVIAVTEEEYARMLSAEKAGEIDTRLYTDGEHASSAVTYGAGKN